MSLITTILAHLQHEREPIDRWLLASELAKLDPLRKLYDAKGERPVTQREFYEAIGEAFAAGVVEVVGDSGKVRLVKKVVESTQRELFT